MGLGHFRACAAERRRNKSPINGSTGINGKIGNSFGEISRREGVFVSKERRGTNASLAIFQYPIPLRRFGNIRALLASKNPGIAFHFARK
jgi:hypothetical protein